MKDFAFIRKTNAYVISQYVTQAPSFLMDATHFSIRFTPSAPAWMSGYQKSIGLPFAFFAMAREFRVEVAPLLEESTAADAVVRA